VLRDEKLLEFQEEIQVEHACCLNSRSSERVGRNQSDEAQQRRCDEVLRSRTCWSCKQQEQQFPVSERFSEYVEVCLGSQHSDGVAHIPGWEHIGDIDGEDAIG
jgi:hypothetical protein